MGGRKKWRSRTLGFDDAALARQLFSPQNINFGLVQDKTNASIESRGSRLTLTVRSEEHLDLTEAVLTQFYDLFQKGRLVHPQGIDCDSVYTASSKKTVTPNTLIQRDYLTAIQSNDSPFALGPVDTSKTYLAVAATVAALTRREVKRIVLTRLGVEAGEKRGFLPGDLAEKINPYLRPFYDAFHDMLDFRKVQKMFETDIIEALLVFMRGCTLNDAFVTLDEAQNNIAEQMKMFLLRLGVDSQAVFTGDAIQIDLPSSSRSGLIQAKGISKLVTGIAFIRFNEEYVISHPLEGWIGQAYDLHYQALEKGRDHY